MNLIDDAKARWADVKVESARVSSHPDGVLSSEYLRALAMLADLVPDLIRLAEEPKATYLYPDATLCGHAPYVCTEPKGHNIIPDWGPDPDACHGNGEIQWWRENRQLVFGWGR